MKAHDIKVILKVGVNIRNKNELKFWRERIEQELNGQLMRYKTQRPVRIVKVK